MNANQNKQKIIEAVAIAIFDVIKEYHQKELLEEIFHQMRLFLPSELHNEYFSIYRDPTINKQIKHQMLDKFLTKMQVNKLINKVLMLLLDKNLLYLFPLIAYEFVNFAELRLKFTKGIIFSGRKFSTSEIAKLETQLAKKLQEKIKLIYIHQHSLQDGFIIRINDKVYDFSLDSRIKNLKQTISKEYI